MVEEKTVARAVENTMYNENEYLWEISRRNCVDFYKEELNKIDKDRECKATLSRHVKRRMTKYGIIKKENGMYMVLTDLGKELLKTHQL